MFSVSCDVTIYSPLKANRCFEEAYGTHLQCWIRLLPNIDEKSFFEKSIDFSGINVDICGTNGGEEECVQVIGRKAREKETTR
jgi:hypothetical protein